MKKCMEEQTPFGAPKGGAPKGRRKRVGPKHSKIGPRKIGSRRVGGGGPDLEKMGPRRVGRRKVEPKPPGFHTTAREPQRTQFRVPAFTKKPPKFNEKKPRETEKERISGGRGKKSENLGRSGGGRVRRKVVQGSLNQQQPQQRQN